MPDRNTARPLYVHREWQSLFQRGKKQETGAMTIHLAGHTNYRKKQSFDQVQPRRGGSFDKQ